MNEMIQEGLGCASHDAADGPPEVLRHRSIDP